MFRVRYSIDERFHERAEFQIMRRYCARPRRFFPDLESAADIRPSQAIYSPSVLRADAAHSTGYQFLFTNNILLPQRRIELRFLERVMDLW